VSAVVGWLQDVRRLFAAWRPPGDLGHRLAGWSGDADIKSASAPATTDDKPPDHEDHDLWLQY
jgi:hypothetical protein